MLSSKKQTGQKTPRVNLQVVDFFDVRIISQEPPFGGEEGRRRGLVIGGRGAVGPLGGESRTQKSRFALL